MALQSRRVASKKDQRGVVFTYSYDDARRTTLQAATTIPTGVDDNVQSIGHAYDNLGRVETITSYAGTSTGSTVRNQIKYTYATHGHVSKSQQNHSGAVGGSEPVVEYAYDESVLSDIYEDGLRLETLTYPDDRAVFYGYDNGTQGSIRDRAGRIDEIRETDGTGQQLAEYEYFGGGQVVNIEYPEPDIHQHADRNDDGVYGTLDRFGRTVQAYWRPTTGTGSNYLDRIDYGYDYGGNRTYRNVRVDEISGASTDERDQEYTYDGLDRVIDTEQGTASDSTGLISTKKFQQQWKLDQLGNWEEFDQDDNGDGTWNLEQSRTHNDVNEVTAVDLQSGGAGSDWADPAFDDAGNMTTIPQPGTLTSSYTAKFDAWNRLASLDSGSTASYEYDGLHRRIKRVEGSTTRHFYYSDNWQALEERATEGGDAIKQFVWGANYIDELVLRDRDADESAGNGLEERLYATQDALYNVTSLVNTSGDIVERFAYTPYGESTVLDADMSVKGSGTDYAWEHRYTGRRLDPDSGLQLNRHRYYHQQLGRWCSRDPIGYEGSSNLYSYVTNKSVTAVDPAGLKTEVTEGQGKVTVLLPGQVTCECGTIPQRSWEFEAGINFAIQFELGKVNFEFGFDASGKQGFKIGCNLPACPEDCPCGEESPCDRVQVKRGQLTVWYDWKRVVTDPIEICIPPPIHGDDICFVIWPGSDITTYTYRNDDFRTVIISDTGTCNCD